VPPPPAGTGHSHQARSAAPASNAAPPTAAPTATGITGNADPAPGDGYTWQLDGRFKHSEGIFGDNATFSTLNSKTIKQLQNDDISVGGASQKRSATHSIKKTLVLSGENGVCQWGTDSKQRPGCLRGGECFVLSMCLGGHVAL